jgi:hypothetical protein
MENDPVGGAKVNFGNVQSPLGKGFSKVLQYAISKETKDRSAAGRLSSKLVSLRWVKVYQEISKKKKLEEWISVLYYAAKKEGGTKNGVFIKPGVEDFIKPEALGFREKSKVKPKEGPMVEKLLIKKSYPIGVEIRFKKSPIFDTHLGS